MTLVFDQATLPFPGGVLTPAVACGEALAHRLIHSGVKFKMGDWWPGSVVWGVGGGVVWGGFSVFSFFVLGG